jgi:hypothetical protein
MVRNLLFIFLAAYGILITGCADDMRQVMATNDYKGIYDVSVAAARDGRLLEALVDCHYFGARVWVGHKNGDPRATKILLEGIQKRSEEFGSAPIIDEFKKPGNIDQAVEAVEVSERLAPEFYKEVRSIVVKELGLSEDIKDEELRQFYKKNKDVLQWDPRRQVFVIAEPDTRPQSGGG